VTILMSQIGRPAERPYVEIIPREEPVPDSVPAEAPSEPVPVEEPAPVEEPVAPT